MNWILIVVTTVSVLNNRVETTVTEQRFSSADQCTAALSRVKINKQTRFAYCRNENNGRY